MSALIRMAWENTVVVEMQRPFGEANTSRAVVRTENGKRPVCVLDFGYGSRDDKAVAKLVGAAPELLICLKLLVETHLVTASASPDSNERTLWARALSAIEKAEGR